MNLSLAAECFERAKKYIPGGVNSPVRAFKSVGGTPPFINRASGSTVNDVDGNTYVDYVGSWGPAIVGHAHPEVVEAVQRSASNGLTFGAPTEQESELAELICDAFPAMDMVRFVSSGTEACMTAIRLARAFTGKEKILKFDGCYHGHADSLLVKAGSGVATLGLPDSPGVPSGATAATLSAPFNDIGFVEAVFAEHGDDIAAIILEPIAGNAGFIMPNEGFLPGLRQICDRHQALLIFDEVMTGFRLAWGGYQNTVGIEPDITTLAKVIGGGLPLAAYGGRRQIMEMVAPQGPMYQAGTLSGNPLSVAAGFTTLKVLQRPGQYELLAKKTQRLVTGLKQAAVEADVAVQCNGLSGMFGLFFNLSEVKNFEDAKKSNTFLFQQYFRDMLNRGFYLAPSPFESGFISLAHSDEQIDSTLAGAREVFKELPR